MLFRSRSCRGLLLLVLLLCWGFTPTNRCLAAGPEAAGGEDQPKQTVKQRLKAHQARLEAEVAVRDNFLNHLRVYVVPPEFRDEAYLDEARAIGIDKPAKQIPYYRYWHSFMYTELEETKALRDQYALLLSGQATPEQIPDVKRWLESVWPAMDAIRDAAQVEHFSVSLALDAPLIRAYREIHYIQVEFNMIMESFRARALYSLALADTPSAVADCIAFDRIHKLCFQLNHHETIDDAPREASDNNDVLLHLLQSGQLTEDQLKALAKQWAAQAKGSSAAEIYDQWERLLLIDYFERIASGEEKQPSFLLEQVFSMGGPVSDEKHEGWEWMVKHPLMDTDLAIAQINRRYDELVEVLNKSSDVSEAVGVLQKASRTMRGRMGSMQTMIRAYEEKVVPAGMNAKRYSEQIVDGMLALFMHPNRVLDGPFDQAEYKDRQRMAQAMIAVVRYHKDQGSYPEKLQDVVPKYLAELPMDPYQKEQAILYGLSRVNNMTTIKLHCVRVDQDGETDDLKATLNMPN